MTARGLDHWAVAYIGMPWTRAFTCWHFCALVWAERFGQSVPLPKIDGGDARATRRALAADKAGWAEVAAPQEGDGVLMAKGAHPCHVGIWLSLGGVLHCVEGAGVIFTRAERLTDMGYRIAGIYRRQP